MNMSESCLVVLAVSGVIMTIEKVAWFTIHMYWQCQAIRKQREDIAAWVALAPQREEQKAVEEREHAAMHEKTSEFQGRFLEMMERILKKEQDGDDWKGE